MRGNGKTNEYGMLNGRQFSDYGDDDINMLRDDLGVTTWDYFRTTGQALTSGTKRPKPTGGIQTIALLDESMPARVSKYDKVREPDFYEGGYAHWIGEDGVCSVLIERMAEFHRYMAVRGLVRCDAWHLSMYAETPRPLTWQVLAETCNA